MAVKTDGTVYINTEIDSNGFNSGVKSMQSGIGNLSKSLKKLGIVIGSVFAIRELVQFGKEAVNLGSDLQEVQNVVDVTFTKMSDKVDDFARNAAKSAGLSETMAKRYVGTFGAMAKSFGFIEEDALKMSTSLTQLSGDVASFYNLTQDEAYTKLKSVFTGETESLKDLGVVMTQTALDQFALQKGLGKTTKQMSEQEKVALRYSFVMDQLSAASGDFLRTSDGWANQTRILRLNIESLKANVGQGLITLFTPIIKVLNIVLERLVLLAQSFKNFVGGLFGIEPKTQKEAGDTLSELGDNFVETSDGIGQYVDAAEDAEKATKRMLSPFDELNLLTSDVSNNFSGTAFEGIGAIIEGAEIDIDYQSFDEMEERVSGFVSKIEGFFKPLGDVIKRVFGRVEWKEVTKNLRDFWDAISPYADEFGQGLLDFLEDLGNVSADVINFIFGEDGAITGLTDWLNANDPEKARKWGYALGVFTAGLLGLKALGVLKGLSSVLKPTALSLTKFAGALALFIPLETFFQTSDKEGALDYLQSLEKASNLDFENMEINDWINSLKELFMVSYGLSGKHNASNTLAFSIPLPQKEDFETLEEYQKALEDWKKEFLGAKYGTEQDYSSLKAVHDRTFNKETIEKFNEKFTEYRRNIKETSRDASGSLDGVIERLATITGMMSVLSFGIKIPNLGIPVPALATGAVIPPNAPFMAMLGDQRHGTNIEAPLDTIKQAVAEVMASMQNNVKFEIIGDPHGMFKVMQDEASIYTKQTGRTPF